MRIYSIIIIILAVISCKNNSQPESTPTNPIKQIAHKAGYDQWNKVKQVQFTFTVGKMGHDLYSRNWTWNRSTGDVTLIAPPDTVRYNINQPKDSIQISADRAFVNDTYWLIPAFKFNTDRDTQFKYKVKQIAPISLDTLNMFTITYYNDNGYTPGDAYDVYYDDNYQLKEWVYRQQNDTIIGMMTTFERAKNLNGIQVATEHRTPDRMTRIQLSNIKFIR